MSGWPAASWLLLGTTTLLLCVSLWIVLPAPNVALLWLGVGAPELSPLLLVAALILCGLAFTSGVHAVHRTAGVVAAIAAMLCALPLARFPGTVRRFDAAIGAAAPTPNMTAARARPLSLRDLVLGIDTGESRVVRGVAFGAPAGRALTADIYQPVLAGRYPIVVQIYGGAWQRGSPGDDEVFARYFASHGYVVFAIDYRHAPAWQWPSQIEDVRRGIEWARERAPAYEGDPTRIALFGRSAGGQLALTAAYLDAAPTVAAVVSYYGATDLAEGWRAPPRPDPLRIRPILEAYLGGTPDEVPERYRAASPVTYASANAPPTLLVHGARDHIVEARFGRELHERLRAAGATSVLLEIPWAEHAFDAVPHGLSGQLALYYTERFLARTLGS